MSHKNDLSFIAELNGKQKFSFRKLSVGLVTVALGTTFFLESSHTVQAAETDASNQNIASQENIFESTKSSTLNIQKNNTSEDNKNDVKALPTQEQTSASQTNKNSDTNNQELNVLAAKSKTQNNKATQANILEEKVQATNDTQATAVTITGAEPNKSMMANVTQGSINVHVNTEEKNPITINNGQKVTVSISDTNNLLRFGSTPSKSNYFEITAAQTNANKTFTFTYTGNDDGILSGFDSTFTFTADNEATKQYYTDHGTYPDFNLPVTVTLPNNLVFTQNLPIKITPYKDPVVTKEILHGFITGPRLIGTPGQDGYPGENGSYTENGATYYGPEPSAATDVPADKQKSARLMQYALEWNYGSAKDPSLDPLMDVLVNIAFNKGQEILPSTIKAFKIPADMGVVDSDGQRVPINDYYNKLATLPEDTNFEKLLRDSISNNKKQIKIDQKGNFTANGVDYSKMGPYFIQLDTLLNPNDIADWASHPNSGVGPSITTPIVNERDWQHSGSGVTTNSSTQIYTDFKFDPAVDRVVRIHFIDENTDTEIPDTLSTTITKTNSSIDNPANSIVKNLEAQHYLLDEKATLGEISDYSKNLKNYDISKQNFKTDALNNSYNSSKLQVTDTSPQYYVYLYHDTDTQTENATVTEHVNYIYENGPHADETVVDAATSPISQIITYTRSRTIDLVDDPSGQNTEWSNWIADKNLIADFNLPEKVSGLDNQAKVYSLDSKQITATKNGQDFNYSALKLPFESSELKNNQTINFNITVPYTLTENVQVTYIDDTTGKTLETKSLSGNPNADSKYSTKDTIDKYLAKNYVLVSDPTNQKDIFFDNDEVPDNQNYVVHLKHATKEITNSRVVRETIRYIYDNGKEAAPTYTTSVNFTQTGTIDLMTKDEKLNDWTPITNTFAPVVSPIINNYTADQKQINAQAVQPNSSDLSFQVIYTAVPVEPTKPVQPATPVEPIKPVQPVTPTEPTKPAQPVTPAEPTKP
ncbi:mucin-binding protein, partial [Lactobacillus sp.]|uniref:mucin-binding protein n=2 Tax=Lactobacillus TaxID=1578 RepID=UPI002626DD98